MNIFALLIMLAVGLLVTVVIALIVSFLIKMYRKRRWFPVTVAILVLLLVCVVAIKSNYWYVILESTDYIESVKKCQTQPIDAITPVWLPGIEDQFEADVYPSKLSAVRALGLRIDDTIQEILKGKTLPKEIILFDNELNRELITELGKVVKSKFPYIRLNIEPKVTNTVEGQIGITLRLVDIETHPAAWSGGSGCKLNSGRIEANVLSGDRKTVISAKFVEKPWVENLADFLNRNPKSEWILARSRQSCTSEAEAEQQAMSNACDKVTRLLNQVQEQCSNIGAGFTANPADIRNGGFVADRFAQSFAGTAGRIWRQALLINASQDKLTELARQKMSKWRLRQASWIRELASIVAMMILICVVYLFLNAATRGYYTWSLRIAAFVFTLVGILLVFTLS